MDRFSHHSGFCLRRGCAFAAVFALLAGCVVPPPENPEIQALHRLRRSEATLPLAERAGRIERMLFGEFYEERLGMVSTYVETRDDSVARGPVHVEQNAHLLIGLACHYATTGDKELEERARRLIAGLDELDRINGADGFLPLEARVVEGAVEVVNDRFVASSYVQILYAEVLAWRLFSDPALRAAIKTQALRQLDHLAANNLVVVDEHGNPLPYSDASLKPRNVGMSGELETMAFVETGVFFTRDDPGRRPTWDAFERRMNGELGYNRLPFVLHFSTPLLELPTVSSSWLNLMKLSLIAETNGGEKYRRLLHGLAEDYRSHQNPFFIALDLLYGPEMSGELAADWLRTAWSRLDTYPLTNTSDDLGDLAWTPYRVQLPPRYIKNRWTYQATKPVPFYDYAGDRYLWKRNLRLVRENEARAVGERYSGVDFYEAYWLLSYYSRYTGRPAQH